MQAPKAYFAFRGVDYHFRQDYKPIFSGIQRARDAITAMQQLLGVCRLLFCCVPRCAASRRELVDATVVVRAAVHSGAVEVSESIDDHPVVGKPTIWRARERMNDALDPLSTANRL